jgi:hypothetical protein
MLIPGKLTECLFKFLILRPCGDPARHQNVLKRRNFSAPIDGREKGRKSLIINFLAIKMACF